VAGHAASARHAANAAAADVVGLTLGSAALLSVLVWRKETMLMTIAVIFLVLWLLGLVSSYTIGGLIHILLVVAIIIFLVRVIQGRRPVV
jgi:hypothetical protein